MSWLLVAVGGGLGALARFAISTWVGVPSQFPFATLVINIAGSLLIGLIVGGFSGTDWYQTWGRPLLVVGLLGGFTTYSAFSLETVTLIQRDLWLQAGGYVLATLSGCLLGAWLGIRLTSP